MHAPDGFLEPATAAAAGALAVGAVGFALRRARTELDDRTVPTAGVASAFVFAAQMINFPVAAGTSGHLVGAALAAILLGPAVGTLVVAVVVIIQALVFADGGVSALGINLLNLAVVPAFGGWALFSLFRRILPRSAAGVVGASGLAAGCSVVLGAAAFSLEWLFGASAPIPFDTVFGAMVGVHTLIGVGEGVITGAVVAAVLASRPDLVAGAADLDRSQRRLDSRVPARTFLVAAVLVAVAVATVAAQFADGDPDGLESVAAETGFEASARPHPLAGGPFADYATEGVGHPGLSLAVAGGAGVVVALAVGVGMARAVIVGGGGPERTSDRGRPSPVG